MKEAIYEQPKNNPKPRKVYYWSEENFSLTRNAHTSTFCPVKTPLMINLLLNTNEILII